tara:strand:- start:1714 stop:2598 length:885 start_codon:yes stop_codon:yes gene_type:complete
MKTSIYIFLSFIGIAFTSCTDVIQLDLADPQPVLVVDGYISNLDTTQFVKLSNIENYFANQEPNYAIHKSATVALLENGTTAATYVFNDSTAQFETKFAGTEGKEYQIDIRLEDGTHYISASEIMEPFVPIDSLWSEINKNPGGPGPQAGEITIKLNTKEPKGLGDNYQWKTYLNNDYQNGRGDLFFQEDRFVDGQEVKELDVFGFSEKYFQEYADVSPNGKVYARVEQIRISYRYFKYLLLVYQQLNQVGGPFAAPPAEIQGNVYKQGENEVLALGYFYTAGIDTKTIEVLTK